MMNNQAIVYVKAGRAVGCSGSGALVVLVGLAVFCSACGSDPTTVRIIDEIDGLPPAIVADEKLLRQVFSNLLSNAVKYAPDGTSVRVMAHGSDHDEVVISVRDEGVGIPEQELKELFQRFFRASTSTGIPGTGIGLHLVKHLVELHGGRIEVATEAKKGSVFTVRLPIAGPAETTPHPCCDQAQPYEAPSVNAAA